MLPIVQLSTTYFSHFFDVGHTARLETLHNHVESRDPLPHRSERSMGSNISAHHPLHGLRQ